jgi:cystathionine beta-lyase family protein involved in aluminum resistance
VANRHRCHLLQPLKYESEDDTTRGFCNIKYCESISGKLDAWVQCQGKAMEMYHENCVGAKGKKTFICGICK